MNGEREEAKRVLLIPGLYGSGPEHWQTLWEQEFGFARLAQADWETPRCVDWVAALDAAVASGPDEVVLVAHSLGSILVAHWAAFAELETVRKVRSAMLVAPSDTERPDFPAGATGFAPIPLEILPFRSVVVASTNDRYTGFDRAVLLAACWGSELIDVGRAGHITTADGFGPWTEGLRLLDRVRAG